VVEAISSQAQKLIHVSNYFYIEGRGEAAAKLSAILNGEGDGTESWKTFFANSGAEANECAIKLARHWAAKRTSDTQEAPYLVVTMKKSFHGRTLATLSATGQDRFHKEMGPMPEGFVNVAINDVAALESAFTEFGDKICAVMIEAVQGESGVHVCEPDFLQAARKLTQQNEALLIFDEVQCGLYRCGAPFAFQLAGVVPDVVTMAKGIASGMVAGACAARGEFGDVFGPGEHGSTFGGSSLAIAAINATLDNLVVNGFAEGVAEVGEYFAQELAKLPQVTEVRGLGLMRAAELTDGIDAHDVVNAALEAGLVINATGGYTTLRFLPPLIATREDVDEAIKRLSIALDDVDRRRSCA
jgi:acetylornithine aminotransferase